MTEIKLHTFGERLIVSEKVTLASGNINSAELHVTVDEAWAAYSNFSATFETKEYIEPVERLMVAKTATEYVCIIPSEVLQHQGILEIGIRGISNDGEMAKTSSIAKYNIVKGASPANITLKPSMDLYQQYLAAVEKAVAPAQDALLARLDVHIKEHEAEMAEEHERFKAALIELMQPVPLWTNENPAGYDFYKTNAQNSGITGEASAIKVPLDLSGYSSVLICFIDDPDMLTNVQTYGGDFASPIVKKGESGRIYLNEGANGNQMYREFEVAEDGITFYNAERYSSGYYSAMNRLVPYKIYALVY